MLLGPDLCRDEAWLRAICSYTAAAGPAALRLRLWPEQLRWLVHWFNPNCQKARAWAREAGAILNRVLRERKGVRKEGRGVWDDALEWWVVPFDGDWLGGLLMMMLGY